MAVDLFKLQGSVEVNTGKAEADLKRVDVAARKTQTALSQTDQAGKKAGSGITSGFNSSVASGNRLSGLISNLQSKLNSLKAPSLNFGGGSGGGIGASVSMLTKSNLLTGAITSAMGGLTDALKDGFNAGVEYNKMLEKASISFTTLLGSTDKAQAHLKALQAFGESTPFEFPDLIKASQRMQAMGFSAESVIPSLRAIGDAVSAVGGGKEELDGVVLALGQMQTKGKVSAEEMNQLAERGIPAWDLLAKAIGKTKEETIKLSEQGRLNGARAVQGITAMMGERFGGQMDKMSGTLEGRQSNLNDILNRRLGEATKGTSAQLSDAMAKGAAGLATQSGADFAQKLDQMLTKVGADFAPMLQKFANGEYFMQGLNAINFSEQANAAFDKGDFKGGANFTGQAIGSAIGMKRGAAGEDQTANAIADSLKQKPIFSSEFDAKLISWITGALMKAEAAAKEGGKLVGIGTGQSIKEGTATALDAHSPSRVMMALGHDAVDGFVLGYESGKRRIGSIVDAEEIRKKTLAELEKLRDDPRIKAMLDVIAQAEGTGSAYNMKFGGGRFSDLSAHPNDPVTRKMGGKAITSTAAGRYQFLNRTWSGLESQLGLSDFSAKNQDLGAIQLMKSRGMIDPILKGDIAGALTKGNREWASLPGSPYGQPTKKADELVTAYNSALEKYNGLMTQSSGLMAQLNSLYDQAAAKLSTLTESAKSFLGLGATTAAAAPIVRAAPQQSPQTVQGGQLGGVTIAAKAEALTLSADAQAAASSIGAMTVSAKTVAVESTKTTEALKATGSQAGQFADAIMDVGKATKEAIDHFAGFKDAFASGIDDIFDGNFSAKDFGKSLLKNLSGGLISQATGGAASSPGQFLSKMLFGGLSGGGGVGGGGIGSVPATGGFAGGGGAADILKGAAGQMNFGKLPGMGKVGGFLSKIPFFGKLFGGGASAATGAAGAGAAAGGGGFMSGLLGAAGGPVGLAIGLGLPLVGKLFGLFGGNPLKDYKKLVKGEYGFSISDQVASKIMQAGQSKFGNEWQKRKIETVRLPEIRDMLSEYSGAFMKGGNDKLFDSRMYSDAFSAVNQIKVPMRANGGRVRGGKPYLVGERRAEIFVPYSDGQVMPNAGRGGMFGKGIEEVLARVAQALDRFESMPAEQVVVTGIARRPGIAAADVRQDFERRGEHSQRMREILAAR